MSADQKMEIDLAATAQEDDRQLRMPNNKYQFDEFVVPDDEDIKLVNEKSSNVDVCNIVQGKRVRKKPVRYEPEEVDLEDDTDHEEDSEDLEDTEDMEEEEEEDKSFDPDSFSEEEEEEEKNELSGDDQEMGH